MEVVCECCAAHPRHRCLRESLRTCHGRVMLRHEIPTLNIESAVARSLDGGAGVLSRTSAVEFSPEIFGPCTPY
jgi:hypothetical protein